MKSILNTLIASALFAAAGAASAGVTTTTEDFVTDTLRGSAVLSPTTRPAYYTPDGVVADPILEAAFEAAINPIKLNFIGGGTFYTNPSAQDGLIMLDASGDWVINSGSTEPDYFALKFGTASAPTSTKNTYFFFENVGEFNKLVFNTSQVGMAAGDIGNLSDFALYGVSFKGEPPTDVPEPASLGLMGLGLAGFMAARRRKVAPK